MGDFAPLVRAAAALLSRTPRARLLLARSAWSAWLGLGLGLGLGLDG